jgi:hypothetical protein
MMEGKLEAKEETEKNDLKAEQSRQFKIRTTASIHYEKKIRNR